MIKNSYTFNFKTFLAPMIILLACLIGEASFRIAYFGIDAILDFTEYTPGDTHRYKNEIPSEYERAYTLIPNQTFRVKGEIFTTNKYGFRERDVDLVTPKNKYRIAILGSSYTIGMGVLEQERYSNQLQIMLDNVFPDQYEVLNFAVHASSVQEVIATYESSVIKFNPDIILYPPRNLKLIKQYRSEREREIKRERDDINIRKDFFSNIFLYRYARYEFKQWYKKHINVKWSQRLPGYISNSRKENIETNIKSLGDFLQRRSHENIQTILLGLPKIIMTKPGFDHKILKQLVKKIPRVNYLSTHSFLANKISINDNIYPGDLHPNARAHKLYAEAIFKVLAPVLDKIQHQ